MLGYPIVVIPWGHHVQELIPKHVTRFLSGKVTTGPGETLFFKFYAEQNMVADLIRPDTELKKFDQDAYAGTPVEAMAQQIKEWSSRELLEKTFQRGDYR